MVLTVHILIGAAVAEKTGNPILGLLFAFLSHYLMDAIPHQEYSIRGIEEGRWKNSSKNFLKIFLDILIGFFLITIFSKNYFLAFLGGFSAILPDILTFLYFIFPKIKPLHLLSKFHKKTHWFKNYKIKIPLFWGIFTQVLILFLAISIFLR
jgi:hypothetical protein